MATTTKYRFELLYLMAKIAGKPKKKIFKLQGVNCVMFSTD